MKRILIDMDEVMADAYGKIVQHYVEEFGPIEPAEYAGKKIYEIAKASHIRDYLFEPGWFADLEVMADAQRVIKKLQADYEIFIVTSAQEFRHSLSDKHAWLERHFPFIHWKNYVMCGDKSIVSGDYMIDDKVSNLATFDGLGMLFSSPHNIYDEGYVRVNNWLEVEAFFEQQA